MDQSGLDTVVILCCSLSILACLSIIVSYFAFRKLTNLFYRITLYHALLVGIQALGLLTSTVLRLELS